MSEIAIWEKMNGTELVGMGQKGNGIVFENTVDYHSWNLNEIHQYRSQQTWTVFPVQNCSSPFLFYRLDSTVLSQL